MGFSTSGAVIIILIGLLVAFSAIVPTVFDITDRTGDAFSAQNDQLRDQKNTAIAVVSFEPTEDADGNVIGGTVNVTNDGSRSLSVDRTDLVVNGAYYPTDASDTETTTIIADNDERSSSDIWLPGTHLEIEIDNERLETEYEIGGDDDRVRIATDRGIAETATIGGGSS